MSIKINPKKCVIIVLAFFIGTGPNAKADFTFGEPVNLGPNINTSSSDATQGISADGLSLYFQSPRPGGYGDDDLYVATRETTDDDWGPAVNLGSTVNTSSWEWRPSISADGLSLFFGSGRPGGSEAWGLWVTTRPTRADEWGIPVDLGPTVNSPSGADSPSISSDGLSLYFAGSRAGGSGDFDLWVTTRATLSDPWGPPVNLGSTVNSSTQDGWPSISADGLALFFGSGRPPGLVPADIWVTTRATVSDPWGLPVNLGPWVNLSAGDDDCPSISSDGRTLYFSSDRPGGYGNYDIWQAPIIPTVDLNSDRKVDLADMHIMVDHWGTDESLCDIGPMPWGDGIVDIKDLLVLAEHLGEDYRLVAHWKLDETEGDIAYDSISGNDGICYGKPAWQPTIGMIGGALLFEGADDYVSTPFILDPAKGSLSVFTWIYGGLPGQVIISQADTTIDTPVRLTTNPGSTWIGTNPSNGRLMTGLMEIYFGPLESESVITDGQWHHIGLVYDLIAMKRRLYVDGAEVAVDSGYVGGVGSDAGLYIGVGQALDTGSFFRGLVDDVRIYDAALSAEEIATLAQ